MRRETREMIVLLSTGPIDTVTFGSVVKINDTEVRMLRKKDAPAEIVDFGIENGRKFVVLHHGGKDHIWMASSPDEDYPISVE